MTVYVYWFEGDAIRLAYNYYRFVTEETREKALETGYINYHLVTMPFKIIALYNYG